MMKKNRHKLKKSFGLIQFGFADLPKKVSGITIARIVVGDKMGCTWCFPHGIEVINATWKKRQRSWKQYRKTQWKMREV